MMYIVYFLCGWLVLGIIGRLLGGVVDFVLKRRGHNTSLWWREKGGIEQLLFSACLGIGGLLYGLLAVSSLLKRALKGDLHNL